ncbi:hypothetical protein QBC44DRAFT_375627 [Cladorrhinum sp. PSN332]|nr:hypothetical protein QBC44DRAFT_375627 [Cladorrhinum sp. PSN332]
MYGLVESVTFFNSSPDYPYCRTYLAGPSIFVAIEIKGTNANKPGVQEKSGLDSRLHTGEDTDRAVAILQGFGALHEGIKSLRKDEIGSNEEVLALIEATSATCEPEDRDQEGILAGPPPTPNNAGHGPAPCCPQVSTSTSTSAVRQATLCLLQVEDGSREEHSRFTNLVRASDGPRLSAEGYGQPYRGFPDAEGWLAMGLIASEKISKALRVNAILEITAFSSLSSVVSRYQVERGRLEDHQVLSDLYKFGDSISNPEDKVAFRDLAEKMWGLSEGSRRRLRGIVEDSHRMQRSIDQDLDSDQDNFREASATMALRTNTKEAPTLELRDLLPPSQHMKFDSLEANQYNPFDLARDEHPQGSLYHYEIANKTPTQAALDLRDTTMSSSILSFLQEPRGFFYSLSGFGQTVTTGKREFSIEKKRQAEKKLIQTFFALLKLKKQRAKEGDKRSVRFDAIVEMLKHLVSRGRFRTQTEVRKYLLGASKVRTAHVLLGMLAY